ncbi:phosphatidylglycerol:prolipoprotein diacylglycerol transferase [Paucidesulfovibrio gracilis DSM 16080]|uniref:Phosphatidylglycerol--prolipoprotein diacylglyceryl transferase n=1 Tax=Paucidesulfovibrio gracilis DSM 16080 TaxID=1121449 RepID=A0A1T4W4V9_9BACT|nr:prolipoprotein diacylglyceryl transferase [Paucidesulfovibrio gracilis]SKA72282.1 phosphatidylglycerol:prolipoprotein diacylglycerol transferase [Paucidesulfovibrio gracilis DSM 16080]
MIVLPEFDPVAWRIGPLALRWYGLAYAAGFAAAWFWGRARARQAWRGMSAPQLDDLLTWLILGLVLGGRLGYVLFYNLPYYWEHPEDIIKVWHGGMAFHGGVVGVALVMWLFARRHALSLFTVADFLVPLVPPGLFLGRLANFVNGELWGRATDVPWAMVFPHPASGGLPRHPSQLYEAGLEGLVLGGLLWWYSRVSRPRGRVTGLFLAGYGVARFLVEFTRQPDAQLGFVAFDWLSMGQVLSLPMVLFGGWLLLRRVPEDH